MVQKSPFLVSFVNCQFEETADQIVYGCCKNKVTGSICSGSGEIWISSRRLYSTAQRVECRWKTVLGTKDHMSCRAAVFIFILIFYE